MTQNSSSMDVFDPDSAEARAVAEQEAEMIARGEPLETKKPMNFYGFGASAKTFMLPDGIQYIEYKPMNSGMRDEYEHRTQRDISVHSASKKMNMRLDPAKERAALLEISITGWNLLKPNKNGELVQHPFSQPALREFLRMVDPSIVMDLETEIRRANKWLVGDASLEDLYEQREALEAEIAEMEGIQGED